MLVQERHILICQDLRKRQKVVIRSKLLSLTIITVVVISLFAALASSRDAKADTDTLVNGSFETGNLSGWTIGLGGNVEVLQAGDFSPEIAVPEGSWFTLLSTGSGEVNLSPGSDLDGNGSPDNDSATLRQAFALLPDQLPATLSFRWNFLSADTADYDDFFMVTLDGARILAGSVPGSSSFTSPFTDVPPLDQISYTVTSDGLTNGSIFDAGSCGFQDFSYMITTAGSHTLKFTVADQEDLFFDSGLLIDTVRLTLTSPSPPTPTSTPTPTPSLTPTLTPAPTQAPTPTPTQTPALTPASTPVSLVTPAATPEPTSSTPVSSLTPQPTSVQIKGWLYGGIAVAVTVLGMTVSFLLIRRKGDKTHGIR